MSAKPVTEYIYDSDEALREPNRVFERIRRDGGVVWSGSLQRWLVVSRSGALAALKTSDLAVYNLFTGYRQVAEKTGNDFDNLFRVLNWIPFLFDGSRHKTLRGMFTRFLTSIRVEYVAEAERVAARLIDDMVAAGQADFARDYSDRLHIETLGGLLDFPEEDRQWIAERTNSQGTIDFATSVRELLDADQRATGILNRVDHLIRERAGHPLLQTIGEFLNEAGLGDEHVNRLEFLASLLFLGRDTLSGTLTIGLGELLDANNGVLTPECFTDKAFSTSELVRMSSTVQIVHRVATVPLEIDGQTIASGDKMVIFLPAANRSPEDYQCPHQFNEAHGKNLAFGAKRHLCPGRPVSLQVVAMTLNNLSKLRRIESLPGRELAGSKNTRKYETLPLRLEK